MEIPGLIAKKTDDDKLTSAERQAKRDSFSEYMKNWKPNPNLPISHNQQYQQGIDKLSSYTSQHQMTAQEIEEKFGKQLTSHQYDLLKNYTGGVDPFNLGGYVGDFLQPQKQPFYEDYSKKFPGPFGPAQNPQEKALDMADYLQAMMKPKKSEFELLLENMFDRPEKEQFLMTLGFEFFHEDGKDWMQRTVAGHLEKCKCEDCFDRIFLREMTIKFKNLLISKNSLKMKL